jgi:hypothetical protein
MKNSFLMAMVLALSACSSVQVGQHQNDFSYRSDVNVNLNQVFGLPVSASVGVGLSPYGLSVRPNFGVSLPSIHFKK